MTKRELAAKKRKEKEMYRRRRIVVFSGLLLIIVFLIYGVFFIVGNSFGKDKKGSSSTISSSSSSAPSSSSDVPSSSEETPKPESAPEPSYVSAALSANPNDWNLLLVNRANPIPENYEVDLVDITDQYKFDSRAADALTQMLADAAEAGHPMVIRSTYRSQARSKELYDSKVQEYINSGYSQEDAEEEAARWIAPPGTSEHHTGLAVDVVSAEYDAENWDLLHEFENYAGFTWLYNHCADYGFILRYPEEKQDVTKITYEPWHYRYVGKDIAKYIMENDLCLEEYIDLIS